MDSNVQQSKQLSQVSATLRGKMNKESVKIKSNGSQTFKDFV